MTDNQKPLQIPNEIDLCVKANNLETVWVRETAGFGLPSGTPSIGSPGRTLLICLINHWKKSFIREGLLSGYAPQGGMALARRTAYLV